MRLPKAILLLLFCCSTCSAQEERHRDIVVGLGLSFPLSPQNFSELWNVGYNIGGGLETSLSPIVNLGASFEYNNFALDNDKVISYYRLAVDGYRLSGRSVSIVTVSPFIRARFYRDREKASPFLIAGLGYLFESTTDLVFSSGSSVVSSRGDSRGAFSLRIGFGVDIPLNQRAGIYLQSEFVNGFTDIQPIQFIPCRASFRYSL